MKSYCFLVLCACILGSVISHMCDDPWIDDFPQLYDFHEPGYFPSSSPKRPSTSSSPPWSQMHQHHHHHHQHQFSEAPVTSNKVQPRPTPTRVNSVPFVTSKNGEAMNSMQQTQMKELHCLQVLDNLIANQWQEDIDVIPVKDLRKFSAPYIVPEFKNLYSNPESEWLQDHGMALNKLDKCVRNLVSKTVPRMNRDEIDCLNKMWPDYLWRENKTAIQMKNYIEETSREEAAFRSFYTYFDLTEILFQNRIIESLDAELAAIYEDMDFYVESEEDKTKKIFIIDQECDCKHIKLLKEASNDEDRFKKFGQLIKTNVNSYLVAEILRKWVPGAIIPQFRYSLWEQARNEMDLKIRQEVAEVRKQKRDAQALCLHAAKLANEFFKEQKEILFEKMNAVALSSELKTRRKYSHVLAMEELLAGKNDNRLSRVKVLVKEYKEGFYCLTNFVRMIENHQRYMIASAFVNDVLPYGYTFCRINRLFPGLLNPRYCKCQGTFCEEFGLANVRAERFQLTQYQNGSYAVTLNSSYRAPYLDEFISDANQRVAEQKFDTWWYQHQKVPILYV